LGAELGVRLVDTPTWPCFKARPFRERLGITMHTSPKLAELESAFLRTDLPEFRVGDSVRVHYRIVEGDKERTQVFQGVVVKRHRAGARSTFTVRKVSFNVGVERIFLTHSPRIEKVEVVSRGVVRRARLFYLRDLAGKAARVRDQKDV
jgi:large subunit ribosomal protein L19